jgi:hypothetical protein
MTPFTRFLFSSLLLFVFSPAWAVDLGNDIQAHGFITQSIVYTSDNNFGGESDDNLAWDLRELGANLSWRPNSDWLVSGQVLARWAGETDTGDLRLDYGFVEYALINAGDDRVSVALGKIKNPYGFYNTTRDVAHTRPGVLMPQSIYLDRIRNFFLAAPGATLRGEHDRSDFGISWQVSTMKIEADDKELENVLFLTDMPGKLEGRQSWLGQVMTDFQGGLWRAGISLGDVSVDYLPSAQFPQDELSGRTRLQPWVLSLQHNREALSLTAEYSRIKVSGQDFFQPDLNSSNMAEGWYLQATWRPRQRWQSWLRYEQFFYDVEDKSGSHYQTLGLEPYIGHSKAWILGVRHDITPDLALSAEVHHVDGVGSLSPQDNPGLPGNRYVQYWDMLLMQVAWRF